jgi:hypothetical protein
LAEPVADVSDAVVVGVDVVGGGWQSERMELGHNDLRSAAAAATGQGLSGAGWTSIKTSLEATTPDLVVGGLVACERPSNGVILKIGGDLRPSIQSGSKSLLK